MAIAFSITATPQLVPLTHDGPHTIENDSGSANDLYYRLYRRDKLTSTFTGNAAALAALAAGKLAAGELLALPANWSSIDVACETAGTATLNLKAGVLL